MLQLTVLGVLVLVVPSITRELTHGIYKKYTNRRLESVMTSLPAPSRLKCTTWCSETDGYLAVNVIGNHGIMCELTTGLSNGTEFLLDRGSRVFVLDYNSCEMDPGLCQNGATCEPVWTSARCHCSAGYYGGRCDTHFIQLSEKDCNFEGDINALPNTDLEACKIWCGDNERCGGFAVAHGTCWFKNTTCDENIFSSYIKTFFLKQASP